MNIIVTMTTSISFHVKDEKYSLFTARDEKIKFWEQDKSRCVINISMAKLKFMLLSLLKKRQTAVNDFTYFSVR